MLLVRIRARLRTYSHQPDFPHFFLLFPPYQLHCCSAPSHAFSVSMLLQIAASASLLEPMMLGVLFFHVLLLEVFISSIATAANIAVTSAINTNHNLAKEFFIDTSVPPLQMVCKSVQAWVAFCTRALYHVIFFCTCHQCTTLHRMMTPAYLDTFRLFSLLRD